MEKRKLPKIYGKSIRYLLICITGIVCFAALGIYPNQKTITSLDNDAAKLETDIQEQEMLKSVYEDLLQKTRTKVPADLPCPEKGRLDRTKTDDIPEILGSMAHKSSLQLVDVTPDLKTLVKGSQSLSVDVRLSGDFLNFRDFLIQLEGLPYLNDIEEVQIQPAEGVKEFRLKLALALK